MSDEPIQFTASYSVYPNGPSHYVITTIVNDDPEGNIVGAASAFVFAAIIAIVFLVLDWMR